VEILHQNFSKTHPFDLFKEWLADATASEINDPNAMALATVDDAGLPDVRMVLLKELDTRGFCFYTNMESKKGRDLAGHAQAALCFHWKSRERQVRIRGDVEKLGEDMADAYFATRHPLSKLGAWASAQSRPLSSRAELEARVKRLEEKFQGRDIPRPLYWAGYRVVPKKIEFWQAGEGRLHDRFVFTHVKDDMWEVVRLNP
jgi:pyridoxamine 5'-phosphate oxidase